MERMLENCKQTVFEVQKVNCPDCKRSLQSIENGKKECRKCLQFVEFENGKPLRAIPKELAY